MLQFGKLANLDVPSLEKIKNVASESSTLDFKLVLPEKGSSGSKEFLKDLCAFANTNGGDLVFGIAEKDGIAVEVPGIEVPNPGAEQERLEQIGYSNGIEPRLTRLEFGRVEVSAGRFVFIVRVHRSGTAPHRVSFQGHGHFYARGATTTFEMNVQQIREAFMASEFRNRSIQDFRAQRLSQIGGNSPVRLLQTNFETGNAPSIVVLHLVPLQMFTLSGGPIDVVGDSVKMRRFAPIGFRENDASSRLNLDGLVKFAGRVTQKPEEYRAYTQVFRSGTIECVSALKSARTDRQFECLYPFEAKLRKSVSTYTKALGELGVVPPVCAYLALLRVNGKHLYSAQSAESRYPFDRERIDLPEIWIDNLQVPIDEAIRPMLDLLWNAVGHDKCPYYDENGRWISFGE